MFRAPLSVVIVMSQSQGVMGSVVGRGPIRMISCENMGFGAFEPQGEFYEIEQIVEECHRRKGPCDGSGQRYGPSYGTSFR
jgi:hypothetical protein